MVDLAIKFFLPIYFIIAYKNPTRAILIWLFISSFSAGAIFSFGFGVPDLTFDRIALLIIILSLLSKGEFKYFKWYRLNKAEKWWIFT